MVLRRSACPPSLALLGVAADAGLGVRIDAAHTHSHPASIRSRRRAVACLAFPDNYNLDSDRLLYTCVYSQAIRSGSAAMRAAVDEWTEVIPATTRDTAITFNYDRPDNEPPQTMLLVTSASNTGTWQWADLVAALNETLDLAKKRAVEPRILDPTVYSRFLPATVTAATAYAITIATALTAANGVMTDAARKQCLARSRWRHQCRARQAAVPDHHHLEPPGRASAQPEFRSRAAGRSPRRVMDADQAMADG